MESVLGGDSQPTIAELSPRNKLFKKIDKSFTETEVESLRNLMTDSLIERGRVENASPHQMLNMLEADGKIGVGNLGLLKELLTALNKGKLVQETEAVERQEEKAAAQLMERKRVATEDTDTLAICVKKPKPCPPSTEGQSEISSGYGGTSPSRSGIQSEEETGLSQDGHDISFEGITEAELHERIQELQKRAAIYTSECRMEEAGKVFDELSMLTKRRDRERKGELGFRISLLDRTPEVQEKQEKAYIEGKLHEVLQQHINKTIEKNCDMLEIETEVEVLDEPEVDRTRRNHKQEWLKGQFGIIKVHAKSVKLREDYVHSEGKPSSVDRLFDHLVENRDELDPIVTYLNGMKVQVYDITRGCIKLKFCCLTTESSDHLQDEYNSQRLSDRFQNFMETSSLLQQFGLESVLLDIKCIFFNKDAEKTDDPAEEPCNDMETEYKLEEYEVEASKQSKPGDISMAPSGVTENSISITWEEAAGPGKVSYDVSITPPSGDNPTGRVDDGAPLEYSFTGLVPGTLYTISVTTVGGEVLNATSTVQLRTFPAPPDEISIHSVDRDNNSISITWAEAVGTKDYYTVSISPPDDDNPTARVDDGEPLEYSFTGLTPGTLYNISVTTVSGRVKSAGRTKEQRMSIADTEITHDSDVMEIICEKDHEHEVADASYKPLGMRCDVSIASSEVTKNSINITWEEAAGPGKVSYDVSITPPDGGNPTQRVDDGAPPEYSFISPTSGTVSDGVKSAKWTMEQRTSQPIPRVTQEYPVYHPRILTTRSVLDILHLDLPNVCGEQQPKILLPTERDSREDDLLDELGNLQIPELQEITSEHVSLDIVELEQLMGPRRERSTSMGSKTSGYHTGTQGSGPSRPDSPTGENDMQIKLEALLDKVNTIKVMEDKAKQFDLYCQVGDLYRTKLHNLQAALQYYQNMLECSQELSEDTKQAKAYSRLGLTCDILGLQQEAYRNHKKALTIYRLEIKNESDICIAYKNLASSLVLSGQVSDAKTNYESALAVAMETGNKTEQMDIYCKLGDLHREQLHEPQVSHKYYTEMLVLAKDLGRKDRERLTYNRLRLACEDMQDCKAALEWHQKEEQLPAYLNDCYKLFIAYDINIAETMLMIYYRHKRHGCTSYCLACHIAETIVTHVHACNNDHCPPKQFLARGN
ncbi:uncharacterized protein LOC118406455 [Branchiostoma floridae]|uniref:Uncharacterized protein LOC118406455 n=1 Tax=Branchiostoma floridae TaxID=7739 RepID=A0A9J7HQ68_BRAFL|nr:uncharacterized protein LOC118406455 [Branchiostoma floridae]